MKETVLHWKKAARTVLLVLLLGAVGTTNALALDFTEGNLNYTVNSDGTTVTVTGHADGTAATGALDIPESVTHGAYTYAVTEILSSAFSGCTGLTTLTIPATMTFIGDYAFEDCSGLLILNYNAIDCSLGYYDYCNYSYRYRHWLYGCNSIVSLNIGENVQTIPNYFLGSYYSYSSFVGTLTIPNSVTSIGNYAFYGCYGFASVVIGNSVTSIGNYAFHGCYGFATVAFNNSVTTIGDSAFANCSNLTIVVIPESVVSLGADAFYGCTGLISATIGNSVTSLGGTFSGCTNLSSVTIGNSVVSMGNSVFYGCTSLTSVTIPNSVLSMGNYVFYECSNLASVTIGNSVVSIGDQVFKNCTSLTSINIPASVVSIGTEVFGGCTALEYITVASGNPNYDSRNSCNAIIQTVSNKLVAGCKNTIIPNTVVTIGERAFSGCTSLIGTLNIPNSVTSIEYEAFSGCTGLVGALDLPNSVTSIGNYALSGCSGLTSLTIPSSVTSIGKSVFSNCTNLVSLNYNAINCSIAVDYYNYIYSEHYYYNHWLEGCSSLVNLAIGENVQVIPDHFVYSRNGNSFIGALTIPNSVISIGFEAFYNCYGFSSVVIGNSVTSIDNEAFYGCSGLVTATIGNSVTNIGEKAFYACYGLTSITFGNSLTSIGNEAFYNCNDLSSVTFPNSVISIGNSAFSSCDGLASVEIGSSVVSIGNSAFSNCSNLSNIITHAETPPTLGSDAFYNVPTGISVYVPCESVEAYTSANWGGFTNIMGACAGEITVTANPSGAGMVSGAGSYEGGTSCTLTATSYGYLPFLNWTKDGEVVSLSPTYSFVVTGDASFVANFGGSSGCEVVIGEGTATNENLPSHSYYDYTLSQQIYTADEIGGSGIISNIAFYNSDSEKTRSYDIYLVHTDKTIFSSNSDWITVAESDRVYSGSVTMVVGDWTVIDFDTPFQYNGVSNLALIVDDNTGSYSQGMKCLVFNANGNQAIYKRNDNDNLNPYNPSGISGTLLSVKNQIKLSIASAQGENIVFADDAVKSLCVANWDTDGDGELSYVEAASVTDLGTVFNNNNSITSFDELQCFTGLTAIGSEAFYACRNLVSVEIPVTVETIGERAFNFCSSLASITFPNSVTTIGSTSFWSCSSLASVAFGNAVAFIGYDAFMSTSLTSLEIPSSVTFIGRNAFGSCPDIEQITVAEDNAVYDSRNNCNAIIESATNTLVVGCQNTVILNTVTAIGDQAFWGCSNLLSINIPNSVISIGENVFGSCSAVAQITVAEDNPAFDSRDNGSAIIETSTNKLIVGCQNTVIPNTVTSIGDYAFYGCRNLVTISIPDAVESIGNYAFNFCSQLASIEIPDNVTDIGMYAFWFCSQLTSVEMGTSVAVLGDGTFMGCPLTSIELPASMVTIGNSTFYSCTNLARIIVRAITPPTIGDNAFHSVNTEIPIYVPCGYESTYSNASWGGFSNFIGKCPCNITATANPTAGGAITGAGTYLVGETCTLTATVNDGYTFINWTQNGTVVSTDATYSFTVTEVSDFVANFALNSYEVTTMASPTEGGVTTGTGTYDHGTTVTLTATANVGYTFINWTLDGEEVSTNITYTFTVTEASAFVANFALNSYEVTVEASPSEGGTATGGGTFDHFTTCTLTATANEGYSFVNWTKDGTVVSTNATYSFTVLESAAFVANFELNSYAITATANPTIGGTVTGSGTYYHFEMATLTATPSTGYRFVNWTKDGAAISANQTLNITVTEAADYVANFETYSYNITALANPSVGGTVTGTGAYEFGETATLTATANANYAFVNWTENGVEVSTEATYSFTVEGSRSLVANFSHDYYWTVNPFAHESTMTIIGIVQINGEEQHSNLLEVGAFSGEECRGREWLTDQYYVDLGHYLVFLTVYGDDDSADEITFRLYDHAVGEEIDKTCVTTLFFETDAIYGSNTDPFALNFIDENVAQTTNFNNGWNWWSSFIELDGANSLQSLENSLGTNGMMIKSQNDGYASYLEGFGWYGSLTTINNESTYQIRANEACTVEMTGSVANPAEHPIELHSGWTWVGYPVAVSMDVEDALAGIEPLSGDMLKSQNNGFASYLEGFGWYGSLSILNPGMGLMYKSNNSSNITLTYPNGGTRTDLKPNQTSENNHWQPNLNAYPDNMSVMAVVELDGNELEGENYELAAFANGEVRGSARLLYVEPLNRYMAFLTVAGDEAAELRFGLYNTETGEECIDSDNVITYVTNAVVGSFAEPYVVRFRGATGVDEWANSLNVYPNPVQRGQNVTFGFNDVETSKMRVEIINALGAIVETWRATSLQTITAPETAGVYTLRVTLEGKGTCYRKLVVR